MRTEPNSFTPGIVAAFPFLVTLRTITAPSFPTDTFPCVGNFVLAFVSAEGDSHARIVAPFKRPFTNFVRDLTII